MPNELLNSQNTPLVRNASVVNQSGNHNIHINSVNTVQAPVSIVVLPSNNNQSRSSTYAPRQFNKQYYNLFVHASAEFPDNGPGRFVMDADRVLNESINPDFKAKYATLTPEAIEELKAFPALFVTENYAYGKALEDQFACYGIITDIIPQDNGVKIYYHILFSFPQDILNQNLEALGIQGTKYFTELNRTHWTVKKVNLMEELNDLGVNYPFPY